jgi:hypothetical protein
VSGQAVRLREGAKSPSIAVRDSQVGHRPSTTVAILTRVPADAHWAYGSFTCCRRSAASERLWPEWSALSSRIR